MARQGPRQRSPSRRQPGGPSTRIHRLVQFALLLGASVLVVNAFVGENGLVDALKAGRRHRVLVDDVTRLRRENATLRQEARRLQEDPTAVEEIAREELGLIAPGELLFLFTDEPRHPR